MLYEHNNMQDLSDDIDGAAGKALLSAYDQ